MTLRIGISGLGRIGRLVLRARYELARDDIVIAAINDTGAPATQAHLLEYDSTHGRWKADIDGTDDAFTINGERIPRMSSRAPEDIDWAGHGVDVVLDCTGAFRDRAGAERHLGARGGKKVLISAPAEGEDRTVVYGVNHLDLTADDRIVSCASCTTNGLAPVAKVLDDLLGIEHGFCTTIHSYTSDQQLLDNKHSDLHRARGAAQNLVPTKTGAAKAVGRVLPGLQGRLDGVAIRVPTANVSLVDLKILASRKADKDTIAEAMKAAEAGPMAGVLGTYDKPLVSGDFNHDSRSSVFALKETKVIGDHFVRVMSWYDNEWAFSVRMLDVAQAMNDAG